MSIDKGKHPYSEKSVTVHLPDHDDRSVRALDQSGLNSVLAAIMGDKHANAGLSEIVLKGGVVKAAARQAGDVGWTKTVWRRSGPLLTDKPLIDPADLKLPGRAGPG